MSPRGVSRCLHPLRRSPRLYERVVQQLVSWADSSGLGPGDRLPAERDLAVRLAVTRATLAQALAALEVTGMVSVRPRGASRRLPRLRRPPRRWGRVVQQLVAWANPSGRGRGGGLPAERDLAVRLGVSRATLAQALAALEVTGMVSVRHGNGTVLLAAPRTEAVLAALRARGDDLGDVSQARQALEVRLAALAAHRRTEA